jgi:hypothetical protein
VTTIIVDDEISGSWTPKDPDFVQPTIQAQLAKAFDPEADFYVCNGQPYIVYPQWDYATDWSKYPISEVHPFYPLLNGTKITEAEFRTLVKATHGLS